MAANPAARVDAGWWNVERMDVLVIEDRPSIRLLMETGLAQAGLRVRSVGAAGDAWAAIGEAQPDLVICDLLLPGGGGEEFIAALRADSRTRSVPVIVTSGLPGAAELGRRAGADEYIAKPFDLDHLVDRVRFHLADSRSGETLGGR